MMKIIAFMIFLLVGSTTMYAQSTVSSVQFKNILRPSLMLPLTFNSETAEETILSKLKETGYKPEKSGGFFNKKNKEEGFYRFSGVVLPELASQKLDLYFKVEPLKDGANRSSITLLVSKGYDNFVSRENDSSTFAASEKFLNGFVQNTNVYDINQKLDEQRQSLVSSEKKWANLRDQQTSTKKKISELENELKVLQEEEVSQQQEVENLRKGLVELETRRTSAQK